MNLIVNFLLFAVLLFALYGSEVKSQECPLDPSDVDQVPVVVYVNGQTDSDLSWYGRFCSWKEAGFPYDTYAPVTIKVGAEITCNGNECVCPNGDDENEDCTDTFEIVCAAKILNDDAKFKDLLCCAAETEPTTNCPVGFAQCISQIPDLSNQIATCVANQNTDGPREIALAIAKEVIDQGVDLAENTEPFFFFDGKFSKCINDQAWDLWLQTICSMLKEDLARKIPTCVEAMSW